MKKVTSVLPNNFLSSKWGRRMQRGNLTTQGISSGAQVYFSNPDVFILFISATQALTFFYIAVRMDTKFLERMLHLCECILALGLFTLTILKMVWSIQCPYQNQGSDHSYTNDNSTTYSLPYDYQDDDTKTHAVCLSETIVFWTFWAFLGVGILISELKKTKSAEANTPPQVEEIDEEEQQANNNQLNQQ